MIETGFMSQTWDVGSENYSRMSKLYDRRYSLLTTVTDDLLLTIVREDQKGERMPLQKKKDFRSDTHC